MRIARLLCLCNMFRWAAYRSGVEGSMLKMAAGTAFPARLKNDLAEFPSVRGRGPDALTLPEIRGREVRDGLVP